MPGCQRNFILFAPGCRTNQAEAESCAALLEAAGWVRVKGPGGGDLALVAGCVVTAGAERDARKFLHKLGREVPRMKVAILGCLAGRLALHPDSAFAPDLVVGLKDLGRLPELAEALFSPPATAGGARPAESGFFFVPTYKTQDKSRYFFKIQDGCDARCAYCLVRQVRGPLASLPLPLLVDHMLRLLDHGVKEMVFCGTRLGRYGSDLKDGSSLIRLAGELHRLPGEFRWRLSSLEPWDLHGDLLDALQASPRFCRFFHLPLQSGSDAVLRRMNRPYRAPEYRGWIEKIRGRFPGARIGADVIAGFPGESGPQFEETVEFLKECPVDYLHVFPFSMRPGLTGLSGFVPPEEIKARRIRLQALDADKREAYRKRSLGMRTTALSLGFRGILEDNLYGRFDGPRPPGILVRCTVTAWEGATAGVQIEV